MKVKLYHESNACTELDTDLALCVLDDSLSEVIDILVLSVWRVNTILVQLEAGVDLRRVSMVNGIVLNSLLTTFLTLDRLWVSAYCPAPTTFAQSVRIFSNPGGRSKRSFLTTTWRRMKPRFKWRV